MVIIQPKGLHYVKSSLLSIQIRSPYVKELLYYSDIAFDYRMSAITIKVTGMKISFIFLSPLNFLNVCRVKTVCEAR